MRAVLDANVIVSALLSSRGAPARLLERWLEGAFELVVSPNLIDEVVRTLGSSKLSGRVEPGEVEELIALLSAQADLSSDPPERPAVPSEDPGDDYLLVLAASAQARLVSGDRHLLSLADRVPVLSPRDFLELIEA